MGFVKALKEKFGEKKVKRAGNFASGLGAALAGNKASKPVKEESPSDKEKERKSKLRIDYGD